MTTAYYIAGSLFLLLTMLLAIIRWFAKRNAEYEKLKKQFEAAVDAHDFVSMDDLRRRMREIK